MLNVQKLHQFYGGSHILRGLSFEVKVGEVTCLLGRNGVGKTTLLKCLMGLLPVKEGSVQWEGKTITSLKPHQRVHSGIAYVPQGREIFGRLTVEENLLMGLSRFPGSEAKEVPAFIYELFPVLLQMKHRRGGDLSGGQQQQLAIGRALASRPRLLILDEPTEGIQPSVIKEIGAEHVRFHDMRHTFATLSLKSGVDVRTLSETLGHFSAGFTLSTYVHSTPGMKQSAADAIGSTIRNAI